MTARNDESPALAGARRLGEQRQAVSDRSAVGGSARNAGVLPSAAAQQRGFVTHGIGAAPAAYLLVTGNRARRREMQRELRQLAARGNPEAAEVLGAVARLRQRAASGDRSAALTLERIAGRR